MHHDSFFIQAIIYLTAAVISVPIAKRLGLGSVLGYLIAGILIGPAVFGIGEETESIMHFSEFGVVLMLFVIGLELEPMLLWKMRRSIAGLGGSQFLVTAFFIAVAAYFLGLGFEQSVALGLILALSSTALVLQMMNEKGLMKTSAGQNAFSVLLLQDIAVIPIIAFLPMLAFIEHVKAGDENDVLWRDLPEWVETVATIISIFLVVLIGKFLVPPVFRIIAKTGIKELFTAAALLLVIGVSVTMSLVGLSPALGAFMAGVVLANSEYKHELEHHIYPFKQLLLGLFFITVGASINFNLVLDQPLTIIGLVLGLMALKGIILFALGRFFRLNLDNTLIFSFILCQAGEFGFVLFSFTSHLKIFDNDTIQVMLAVIALSMALTPLLMILNEKLILPYTGVRQSEEEGPVENITGKNPVIIAGFGTFGNTIGRFLKANGIEATYLDHDSDQVAFLRKKGFKVYYGDASETDLLTLAGAKEAKLLILAIDFPEKTMEIVKKVKKHFPHLKLMIRAKNRHYAYELVNEGINDIYRENFDTALRMGKDTLEFLGYTKSDVNRAAQIFHDADENNLRELAILYKDKKKYINLTVEKMKEMEDLLKKENKENSQPIAEIEI